MASLSKTISPVSFSRTYPHTLDIVAHPAHKLISIAGRRSMPPASFTVAGSDGPADHWP